jgi:diadenosine tetraphosphatase ApaH/serine/threonine PP2A family protein phosphatase
MRIAILSDIHSNLASLEKALLIIDSLDVERIICLGDIVGYGPFPNACIDLVRNHCDVVVMGNHDAGVAGNILLNNFNKVGKKVIEWTTKQLTDINLDFLKTLPLRIDDQMMTFVHASPDNPSEWNYITSVDDARIAFRAFSTRLCFFGHTHIPTVVGEDLSINHFGNDLRYLINVGSVGQPRDGNPNPCIGILDTEQRSYQLRRYEYDVALTADRIVQAGLPVILAKRLMLGV